MIVLDTNALIRWTLEPDALSTSAADTIAASDQILISSVSFWEIGWKTKQRKLALPTSVREYVARVEQTRYVAIVAVDVRIWLRNVELTWDHRDPADRTIVATADLRGCPLVTSDRRIRDFYELAVW